MKISIYLIHILLFYSCESSDNQMLGTSNYNREITNTENFIAYIHNPNSTSIAPMRSQEIFLVNSLSGKQIQLTNDRFSDSGLSWSPDGNKLLICSRRLKNRMARQHDNRNQAFLFIYNFLSGKEFSLEENISKEVEYLGGKYKNQGFNVEKDKYYEPDNDRPFWISANLIGFKRDIYYGTTSRYGELCTTDTLGRNLKFKRNIFEERICQTFRPLWLNADSIIVTCQTSIFDDNKPEVKLLDVSKSSYIECLPASYYPSSISHDKTKLICFSNNMYILYDLKSGTEKILFKESKGITSIVLSPLNDQIAFVKSLEYEADIYLMDLQSNEIKQLTFDGGSKYSLSWSPKMAL